MGVESLLEATKRNLNSVEKNSDFASEIYADLLRNEIKELEEEISNPKILAWSDGPAIANAYLTFNGDPVKGQESIAASFAVQATREFVNIVTRIAGSMYRSIPLKPNGPIVDSKENQLVITGIAHGSFGFELEESSKGQVTIEGKTAVAYALDQTQILLESVAATDDMATDAMIGIDPSAITSLRRFLRIMSGKNAYCGLETGGISFKFENSLSVKESLARIDTKNIYRSTEALVGYFSGGMPKSREFEFTRESDNEVLRGKISPIMVDPSVILSNQNRRCRVVADTTRVGHGKTKYLVATEPEWLEPLRRRATDR